MLALCHCFLYVYTRLYTSVLHLSDPTCPTHRWCEFYRISMEGQPKLWWPSTYMERCSMCIFFFSCNTRTQHIAHRFFLPSTYVACTVQVTSLITNSVRIMTEQLKSAPAERCDLWILSYKAVVISTSTEISGSEPQASVRLDPGQLAKFDRTCHSASPAPFTATRQQQLCNETVHTQCGIAVPVAQGTLWAFYERILSILFMYTIEIIKTYINGLAALPGELYSAPWGCTPLQRPRFDSSLQPFAACHHQFSLPPFPPQNSLSLSLSNKAYKNSLKKHAIIWRWVYTKDIFM